MLQKIINFIKYHNAFTIGLMLVLFLTAGAFASDDIKNAVLNEITTESGIDNSRILSADLDDFYFALGIKDITEDEGNYYVSYEYATLAIQNSVWQDVSRGGTLRVSKDGLGNEDLGLYVAKELSEVINYELSYLKETQSIEKSNGFTQKMMATQYAGLIGRFLSPKEEAFPGYEPVVRPQESQPEPIAEEEQILPEASSESQTGADIASEIQPESEQQPAQKELVDRELIRQIVLQILSENEAQFSGAGDQPANSDVPEVIVPSEPIIPLESVSEESVSEAPVETPAEIISPEEEISTTTFEIITETASEETTQQ